MVDGFLDGQPGKDRPWPWLDDAHFKRIRRLGGMVGSEIHYQPERMSGFADAGTLIAQCEGARRSFASGIALVSGRLRSGRGRFRRFWHAPEGGLWLTLVLVNTFLPEVARFLPLAVGLACVETAHWFGLRESRLKWVNDLHVGGRKLGGVLVESIQGEWSGEEYLLVGIGINVANRGFPQDLAEIACSMADFLEAPPEVEEVGVALIAHLRLAVGLLLDEERLWLDGGRLDQPVAPRLLSRYRMLCDSVGCRVRFGYNLQEKQEGTGVVAGIADDGALRLALPDGSELSLHAGEISYDDEG